ncbi:MAG: hypothetical protein ABI183_21185 [Polyangiaceae bacterium]
MSTNPTANVLTLPTRHRSAPLIPILKDRTSNDVADLCRSAALGFLANARHWNKADLAEWLQESYRPLVIGAPKPQRKMTPAYGTPVSIAPIPSVPPEALTGIMENAHAEVLQMLRDLQAARSSLDAGRAFIANNVVTRCIDDIGVAGWVPVSHKTSRLAERVMSLFAADFLARPWDYEYDLAICECCENVSFTEVNCCRAHSGMQRVAGAADIDVAVDVLLAG